MSPGLDDLFSPERLRARWEGRTEVGETAEGAAASTPPPPPPVTLELLAALRRTLEARHGTSDADPLNQLLRVLSGKLASREDVEGATPVSPEDRATLDQEVLTLLAGVEDLLEARGIRR